MSGKALPTPPFRFWHGPKIYVLEGPLEYRKYYTSRWYLSDKFKYNNALFVFAEKDVLGDYQIHDISFTLPGRIVEGAYVQHKHIRRLHSFDLQNGSTAATGVAVDYMTRSTIRWLYGFKHRNGVEPANLPELVCYKRDFSAKFIPNQGYPHSLEDYDIDDFKPRYAKYVPVSEYEGDIPSIAEEMEANGFECFYPTDGHLEAMVNGRNYTVDFSRAVVDIDAVVDRIFAVQNDEELESIQQCDLFNTLMDELDMDYLPLSKEDVPTFKQRFEQYCIEHAIDYVK